jgi:hypothetical protein
MTISTRYRLRRMQIVTNYISTPPAHSVVTRIVRSGRVTLHHKTYQSIRIDQLNFPLFSKRDRWLRVRTPRSGGTSRYERKFGVNISPH